MDADALREAIDAPVRVYDSTPNTTDWVRRQGHEGAPAGTFAVANELTAARGRTGNDWSAPSGGVWSSTLLRPSFGPEHVGRLTFAGGLAVADAVRDLGVDARLKWPNDVVVGRKKLAGVLTEAVVDAVPIAGKPVDEVVDGGDFEFATLGIGLNANVDPDDLAADRPATSLRAEVGEVNRDALAADVHDRLLARAEQCETAEGFARLLDDWRGLSDTLGREVRVETRDGEVFEGEAVDVDARGALVVETASGEKRVTEGECERLR